MFMSKEREQLGEKEKKEEKARHLQDTEKKARETLHGTHGAPSTATVGNRWQHYSGAWCLLRHGAAVRTRGMTQQLRRDYDSSPWGLFQGGDSPR